jgi:hypothetical protein
MVELVTLQMRDCIFLSAQEVGLQHLLKTLKQKKCGTYIIRTCVYIYILNVLNFTSQFGNPVLPPTSMF